MITETFLDSCFSIILNKKSKIRKTKALYRDIRGIIEFVENKENVEISMGVQNKVDLMKEICRLFLIDKTLANIVDSVTFSDKYSANVQFIDEKINEELDEATFQDTVSHIRMRKKINALFENYDELTNVLDSIKDGTFDSIDDLVDKYEVTIKRLYANLMESNRAITIEAAASLDFVKDDFEHVIELIRKKYEDINTTSTGFDLLDRIMNGGYEPSRLYVFGGGSGAGKSTFLNNTIYLAATKSLNTMDVDVKPLEEGEIRKVYIYITLENTIEEALMRTYQPMFDRSTKEMLREIRDGVDLKTKINNELIKSGATIIMKYFPAMTIGPVDIMGVLDEVIDEYGKEKIAGLYIDYLDLLSSDTKYDIYRMELGHITLSLKAMAVHYNIPVITATQLTRSVYSVQQAKELNVAQMSESIKKVEHADFVMLFAKDNIEDTRVHAKVGKNRSGRSGIALDFTVRFDRFKFINAIILSNEDKPDSITHPSDSSLFTFSGMGL